MIAILSGTQRDRVESWLSATRSTVVPGRGHAPQQPMGLKEKAEESLSSLCNKMAFKELYIFLSGLPFVLVYL